MTSRRRRMAALAGVVALALVYLLFVRVPAGPRSIRDFDPGRMAQLELGMWQAYYARENVRLFGLLVLTLREQYRYTWATSVRVAFHLARAAATFAGLGSNYGSVLPDLERSYAIARDWTAAGFDPEAVAEAELAWWVARRIPGQNSVENVGALIGEEYALLYETSLERVARAGLLRAEAAAVRDAGGNRADWPGVAALLHASYRELSAAFK